MENWITVMSFSFTHEAHIVKGFLESEGIETELKDEMAAQLQELAVAEGGVKVLVKEADFPSYNSTFKCFNCEKEWKYEKNRG